MPELPEVETIRRQLAKEIVGHRIRAVEARFAGRLNVPADEFERRLRGARIVAVDRRAKLLLLGFSNGETMAVHLKMTGKFLLMPAGAEPTRHDHLVFRLEGGKTLFFRDVRKFGYLKLAKTEHLEQSLLAKEAYGPEPLDRSFTPARFAMCLRGGGSRRIKPRLMSQTCIAGIGNIYADESLFKARIRPDRRVDTLTDAEIRALHRAIVTSLRESVRRRGTSADDFLDLYGRKGTNASLLKVYGRGGRPCPRCRRPLQKTRFAGRGTHFCAHCQR